MEKLLPQNMEAEKGVLGSIIIDPEAIVQVSDILQPEDFYRDTHRSIYEVIISLYRKREPADLITLCEALARRGQLEKVGADYITSLINCVPTSINAEHYAGIVRQNGECRRLIQAAAQIAAMAYEQVDNPLEQAEQLLLSMHTHSLSGFMGMQPIMSEYMEELDYVYSHRGTIIGVPTGYSDLDRALGGLQKSDLILLGGRPGSGKTSLALCLGYKSALKGKKIAIFSLEMGHKQLARRLMAMVSKVDMQRLRNGWIEDDEWEKIMETGNSLAQLPIWINDTAGNPITSIRGQLRRLIQEHQGIDMVIVDYAGLIGDSEDLSKKANTVEKMTAISKGLKNVAREFDVPVLALAQLSRSVESRQNKRPQLSDLRDSGCLTGETLVYLPDTGTYERIDSLVGKSGFHVLALNEKTWKLEPKRVIKSFPTGCKSVYKMTTRLGRNIRATANHKFLTIEGWKELSDLSPKMHISLPRELPGPIHSTMKPAELALLGHLIGDGCTLPRHAIQYTTVDHDIAEIVADLASQVFGNRIAPRINWERPREKNGGWYQVYLSASYRLARGKENPVAHWLRAMDAFGLRSYEKFVPQCVFSQNTEGIAVFLKHLWTTDGTAFCSEANGIPTISYATSSMRLAYDVQSLLLRLHITSRVICVPQGKKGRHQYHVYVSGKTNQEGFIHLVGLVGVRKQALLNQVQDHLATRVGNTNLDILPRHVWRQLVVPALVLSGMTIGQMFAQMGSVGTTSVYRKGLSRGRALKVATALQSSQLMTLAQSEVYWDEIVSIEPDGEEEVYDLTVEEHHNFVANNIIVHNSLEQDADVVLFIYRDDYYAKAEHREDYTPTNIAEVSIAKHRNGPTGEISLYFQADQTMFYDLEVSPALGGDESSELE
jgi:replicative DNA helicase